jgi:hypothetical protein
MKARVLVAKWMIVVLTAVLAWSTAADLSACGDKFLVPSRGMRFELTPAVRQRATVLLYVPAGSSLEGTISRLDVEAALRRAGYRPVIAGDPSELDRLLHEKAWDLVLLELPARSDADVPPGARPPAVIAVASKASAVPANAKKEFAGVLKSPSRSQTFVDAFDAAIATQLAARLRGTQKAR